jgi:hypothetical protein
MRESWSGMNTAAKCVCLAVGIAAVAGIAWMQRLPTKPDRLVDLLEIVLSPAEAAQIRLVLVQNGRAGFQIEQGRLLVPAGEQAACLQALVEANALPEALLDADAEALPSINPFLSQSHQQLVQQQHRARQVRRLLAGLPFVCEATVQLDSQPTASMYTGPDLRCVASIRPHGRLVLDASELRTIKENLLAAIAGLDAGRIVINDLNSGVAWNGAELPVSATPAIALEQLQRIRQCEHQVGLVLAGWPGVSCRVVESAAATTPMPLASAGDGAPPPEAASNSAARVAPGSNSRVRIPVLLPHQTREQLQQGRNALPASASGRGNSLAVELTVTPEAIDHYLALHSRGESGDRATHSLTAGNTEAVRAGIRKELLDMIGKSWQLANAGPLPSLDVRFSAPPEVPVPAGPTNRASWNGWRAGTVWALGSGLVLCGLLTVTMRRRRLKPAAIEPESAQRPDVWFDNSGDSANRDRIRRQIDDLIDRNPEAAAKVIQTWIRDAA